MKRIGSLEDCEGRKVTIDAGGRIVQILVPATDQSPEIELSFGPELTRSFASALLIAADVASG